MLYKKCHIKEGEKVKKVYLNYAPENILQLCDCCDERKRCVSLTMLCGDAAIICKDCLQLIINEFEEEPVFTMSDLESAFNAGINRGCYISSLIAGKEIEKYPTFDEFIEEKFRIEKGEK